MENNLIVCKIDPEKMWLSIAVRRPEGDEDFSLSKEMVVNFIKSQGVKAGINMAAVEALCDFVEYDKDIVVVSGKKQIDGVDGHYQYLVNLEDKKAKPVVGEDGTVDYVNSLKIAMVEEGQTFAVYIPPTTGEFGYNIYSEMLKPIPGKPGKPLKGKGFTTSKDEKEYIAKLSGRIYTDNGRIVIEPLYVVNGDLGVAHGNIVFNGDVEVRGDMHSGTKIEAEGSVFITGHIGNCVIKAGGNVTIGKGVQGKYGCDIDAKGDVAGNYMEHCTIHSGGKIYANSMLDCHVEARDSVIVASKLGCIIGGHVCAMKMIQAKDIGNEFGIRTKLSFGEIPSFRRELFVQRERRIAVEKDIETFEDFAKKLDALPFDKRTELMEAQKRKIAQAKILRSTEKRQLDIKIKELEDDLFYARTRAYICVQGVSYPGVIITTDQLSYVQETATREVYYRLKYGAIEMISPDVFKATTAIDEE